MDNDSREYMKRMEEWFKKYYSSSVTSLGKEGEEIYIYDGKGLREGKIKSLNQDSPFPEWFVELGDRFGEECEVEGKRYKFLGLSYTYLDYYYILEDSSGKITLSSCVGKINFPKDEENSRDKKD